MASQSTKVIDITRGFVPVDPNAFPETYHISTKEDGQETKKDVVPYEGYNFMPTSYGYKSYFGTTSKLDIDALTSRVDEVFIIQTNTYLNIAVALCEDGIWTKAADEVGAWVHSIVLAVPAVGVHYDWSKCIIGNEIYCYRATGASYYKFSSTARVVTKGEIEGALPTVLDPATIHPANQFYAVTPNFLNMAGQQGIFKAGGRLGFWDSEDSTAWSNLDDYADFTPSILTLAGSSKFLEVQGRIVNILAYLDGFIIYSTKSTIAITRDLGATFQWNPVVLMKDAGIAFRKECCVGNTTTSQFAYSSVGLVHINKGVADIIVPEVTDFLKDSTLPIYLTVLEGRYLFLQTLDSSYINGLVTFTVQNVPGYDIVYPPNSQIPTSPDSSALVDSLLDGSNIDVNAQLDKYIVDNFLADRDMLTTFTPVLQATIHDVTQVKPLAEGLPVIGLTQISSLSAHTSRVGRVDRAYTGTENIATIYRYPNPGVGSPYLSYITYHDLPETKELYATFNVLPGNNNSRSLTAPELAGLSLSTLSYMQQSIWATNDASDLGVASYVGLWTDSICIGLDTVYGGSAGTLENGTPYNSAASSRPSTGVREQFISGIYRITASYGDPIAYSTAMNIMSAWTYPITKVVGNSVRIERDLTGRLQMDSKLRFSHTFAYEQKEEYLYTNGNSYWIKNNHYENYVDVAVDGTFFEDSGVTQAAVATITGWNYTDIDGNIVNIPYDPTIILPVVDPFIYTGGGTITMPPSTFLLQDGTIGPVYPTIPGALVYDLELKKWGKMKVDHKVLVDWSPLNNLSGNIIPHEVFGMQGGVLQPDGKIALFDKYPVDSYIKYGKIGYFRQGFTSAEEIRVSFRSLSQGTIRTEASLDGYAVELGITKTMDFTATMGLVFYPSTSARWHTITFIGNYDIKHLEFRGTIVGNR